MSRFLRPLGISLAGRDTDPDFAEAWQATADAADASLASVLRGNRVAEPLSGWGHNYYCPTHGGALEFDETRPDRHRCAEFDHEVTGTQFDTGWGYVRNVRLLDQLGASALAAAIRGRAEDVQRACGILTGLAEVYLDLPLHGVNVGRGRLFAQSLEEAVAATKLSRSYELVADRMTAEQRDLVLDRLFRPMVRVIEDHLMNRTHNIEVWHLAGLASLAVVLDDSELAYHTLRKEHGFASQVEEGLLPDGWWFEGSPGYHFYLLTAVLAGVGSYQALGIESETTAALERMLLTPVETARNDLTVPAFNDSSLVTALPPGLASHADLYFTGAALCRSDRLDRFLGSGFVRGFDRSSAAYLVHGRPAVDRTSPETAAREWPVARRDVLPDSGYAVLRQPYAMDGSKPDTCVFLDFGPHGGGHGHPDKLGIELMLDGSRVIADPGTVMYTSPIHRPWYIQTWSHSTVVVDRISQPPITGRLLGHRPVSSDAFGCVDAQVAFGPEPDAEAANVLWQMNDPAAVAAYADVTIRRVLAMLPPEIGDYLLDLVLVEAPHPRTIDLITHVRGTLTSPVGRSATDRVLLPQFDQVHLAQQANGRTDYALTDGDRSWSRWHTGAEEVLTAETPSNPTHQRCASTVERVVGRHAFFAAVLPLGTANVTDIRQTVAGQAAGDSAQRTVEFTIDGATHRWTLAPTLRPVPTSASWTEPPLRLDILR